MRISIFIVSERFYTIIFCVKNSSVDGLTPKSPVGINNADKLNSLSLFGLEVDFLELTLKKPEVFDKH